MAHSRVCSIPDCGKSHYAHGWCESHYKRWRRHGDPLAGQGTKVPALNQLCSVDECDNPVKQKGLCSSHFARLRRHGDPLGGGTAHGEPLRWLNEVAVSFSGEECLLWPFARDGNGYAQIWIDGVKRPANRIVCERTNGPAPSPGHEAAHSCGRGDQGCINPGHLLWKTHTDNEKDKIVHGTRIRGERHGAAKLTEDDVRLIRSLVGTMPQNRIAARFGVSHTTVRSAANGKSWAWLTD